MCARDPSPHGLRDGHGAGSRQAASRPSSAPPLPSHMQREVGVVFGGEDLVDSQGKEPGATCLHPGLHLALMCTYDALDFCLETLFPPQPH